MDYTILARKLDLVSINKKKKLVIKWILNFLVVHRVKIKESKSANTWILPESGKNRGTWRWQFIVVVALVMVPKGLVEEIVEISGGSEISRPQHCQNWLGYLEEFWRTEKNCYHFSEKSPVEIGMKNSHRVKIIVIQKVIIPRRISNVDCMMTEIKQMIQ